jgi:dolichol-phosphate mannosyltransferase
MDSDGQHPVHLIPEMIERIKSSHSEYIAMVRANHEHLGILKRIGSRGYYGTLRLLGLKSLVNGQADFRILRAKTVSKLVKNKKSIVRLSLSEMKLTFETLEYVESRRLYGDSKYSFKVMAKLASESVFEYTTTPLKISGYLAGVFSIASAAAVIYVLFQWSTSSAVAGWTSLMCAILISGALLFSVVAIQNYYIGMLTSNLFFNREDEVLSVTRVNSVSETNKE